MLVKVKFITCKLFADDSKLSANENLMNWLCDQLRATSIDLISFSCLKANMGDV